MQGYAAWHIELAVAHVHPLLRHMLALISTPGAVGRAIHARALRERQGCWSVLLLAVCAVLAWRAGVPQGLCYVCG
jgi:hypothetical protein